MEITNNNAHEETTSEENEPLYPGEFQSMKIMVRESLAKIQELETQLEQSRESARDQAQRAEEQRAELISDHRERMQTRLDRWQADASEKQERIDALLATDPGKAYADVEDMKRQLERAENRAVRSEHRASQAEQDRDHALASVAGGEDIHPADPRVAHIWRKASRIATNAGFCTEYDRIADALGLPEVEFDYYGTVSVRMSAYVSVPVSGTATRAQISDNEIDWEIDNDAVLDNLSSYAIEWEVDEVEIEAEDD